MSTANPYAKLDPEHEEPPKKEAPQQPKHEEPKHHPDVQKPLVNKNPAHPGNDEELKTEKESHEHQKHSHEGVKPKGVSAEPHPLDRRSGTGRGKEVSKGGAGRHAWGTVNDELKREGQYDDIEEDALAQNSTSEKPLPENVITFDEYKHKSDPAPPQPKGHEPPVLGSHSENLGFKTEDVVAVEPVEKKEEKPHVEKVEIDEKEFPKLG